MPHISRTALITGASAGIGAAIAAQLLDQGHEVIGIGRDFSQCQHREHPQFRPVQLDLADLDALPAALKALQRRLPSLDTLICNAGQGQFGSLEEFSYAQIRALMDLNFTSQAYIARAFLPQLKQQKRGDLIFIGSEAGLKGSRKGGVYCASKFALRGFAQALREECGRSAVRVTLINPGMVKSGFHDTLNFAPGSQSDNHILPTDIAELVSLVLQLRNSTVVDEINLSPLNKVIEFK